MQRPVRAFVPSCLCASAPPSLRRFAQIKVSNENKNVDPLRLRSPNACFIGHSARHVGKLAKTPADRRPVWPRA